MLTVGILATALKFGTLKSWVQAGCFGSCFMLISIMLLGQINSSLPLELAVVGLGFFNGMFAVAAIGSMMSLAGREVKDAKELGWDYGGSPSNSCWFWWLYWEQFLWTYCKWLILAP